MAKVILDNVVKRFGKIEVVHGVNLEIHDKEFLVLVGPSGCGKSTTLRMIAGLEKISEGDVRIGDRVVNDVAPKHRNVAMVFQNYALYPHMNVFGNMSFALKVSRTPKAAIERRIKEVADILELDNLLERKPFELSGGERQRKAVSYSPLPDSADLSFAAMVKQNVEPCPMPSDSTQIRPPWTSTMRLDRARPTPAPSLWGSSLSNSPKIFSW